jgi:hypothetical protein
MAQESAGLLLTKACRAVNSVVRVSSATHEIVTQQTSTPNETAV